MNSPVCSLRSSTSCSIASAGSAAANSSTAMKSRLVMRHVAAQQRDLARGAALAPDTPGLAPPQDRGDTGAGREDQRPGEVLEHEIPQAEEAQRLAPGRKQAPLALEQHLQRAARPAVALLEELERVLGRLGEYHCARLVDRVPARAEQLEREIEVLREGVARSEERRVGKECRSRWSG